MEKRVSITSVENSLDKIAEVLDEALVSHNELDSNMEAANVVDGLFAIARAITRLAKAVEGKGENNDG